MNMTLAEQYKREITRIKSYITRLKNKGQTPTVAIPDTPKRVTAKSLMRVQQITPEVIRRSVITDDSETEYRKPSTEEEYEPRKRRKGNPQNLRRGQGGRKGRKKGSKNKKKTKRVGAKGNPKNLTPHPENLVHKGRKKGSKNKKTRNVTETRPRKEYETPIIKVDEGAFNTDISHLKEASLATYPKMSERVLSNFRGTLLNFSLGGGSSSADTIAHNADILNGIVNKYAEKYGEEQVSQVISAVGLPTIQMLYDLNDTMAYAGYLLRALGDIKEAFPDGDFEHYNTDLIQGALNEMANNTPFVPYQDKLGVWHYLNEETGETVLAGDWLSDLITVDDDNYFPY